MNATDVGQVLAAITPFVDDELNAYACAIEASLRANGASRQALDELQTWLWPALLVARYETLERLRVELATWPNPSMRH